jgi:hypothetical protein
MKHTDDRIFDDELMAAAARLARDVKPQRDLWPGIEQAIRQPARRERRLWNSVWAQAAAVLLLVGGSSALTYVVMSGNGNAVSPVAGNGPALVFEPVSGSFGSQYNLGPDYLDARRDLKARLDEELQKLTPEARDAVVNNLQTIQTAIDQINKALAEEPGNVLLQELLLSTYREELDLMRHVNGIATAALYRGDI